jgi:hypothetical protein
VAVEVRIGEGVREKRRADPQRRVFMLSDIASDSVVYDLAGFAEGAGVLRPLAMPSRPMAVSRGPKAVEIICVFCTHGLIA